MQAIYPKGYAFRFTCGSRAGEIWMLREDWLGGTMHLGEWSSKTESISADGVSLCGDDIPMMLEQAWA